MTCCVVQHNFQNGFTHAVCTCGALNCIAFHTPGHLSVYQCPHCPGEFSPSLRPGEVKELMSSNESRLPGSLWFRAFCMFHWIVDLMFFFSSSFYPFILCKKDLIGCSKVLSLRELMFFPNLSSWWQYTRSRTLIMEVTAPAPAPPAPRVQNLIPVSWAQRRPSSLTRPTVRSRSRQLPSGQVSPAAESCHRTLDPPNTIKLVGSL